MKRTKSRFRPTLLSLLLAWMISGSLSAQTNQGEPGPMAADCQCIGRVGDVNQSGDDEPTIGDVIDLVIFIGIISEGGTPSPLPCLLEADINQSGGMNPTDAEITIGDVATLINYLFIAGPYGMALPTCLEGGAR